MRKVNDQHKRIQPRHVVSAIIMGLLILALLAVDMKYAHPKPFRRPLPTPIFRPVPPTREAQAQSSLVFVIDEA